MSIHPTLRIFSCIAVLLVSIAIFGSTLFGKGPVGQPPLTYSVPLSVRSVPETSEFVTASCRIDFIAILKQAGAVGMVDQQTIRLFRIDSHGQEIEEPVQFSPENQPRREKLQVLPGTNPADDGQSSASGPQASGRLSWIVGKSTGSRNYRLQFNVPRDGRFQQVPFAPENYRAFDADGRATSPADFPVMQLHPQWPMDGVVNLLDGKEMLTTYHIGPTTVPSTALTIRRPYFYPVIGPDGVPLTEFGKPHDPTGSHAHHYSLWIAHAGVNGKDFWSEKGGVIVHEQLPVMEDGPIFCQLTQKTRWVIENVDLMHERRTMTAYHTLGRFRILDFDLEYAPSGDSPVELAKTTFGFLSMRVAQSMTVFDGGGEITNSNGDRNEASVHLKHADWIDLSGPIAAGKWGGIAIFDDRHNPNHPTAFHCRDDGWACASFNKDAPHTLLPGKPLHLKYRVFLHSGNAKTADVQHCYDDYEADPEISIGRPFAKE